ncbi:MAG: hypothetical protein JNN06_16170 [Gemmobacter sp.]|uniref:AAA domain-containing protein n=1 Tax=Gemmobacter sp. TaxID=1898957 RepID=UPI001A5D85A4|nr:AAA domain-containing protein [Gemmobacter sp.]MBL8563806.1 hypothetical protein [Gemmobacter sp.]
MNILRYWRTSLADSSLGEGKFRQKDRSRFIELSVDTLRHGVLSAEEARAVFQGQAASQKAVSVRIWPLVAAHRMSHGASRAGGLPDLVAPVVTEAMVERDGHILPARNTIARDVLGPLTDGEFSIGTVADLDGFLTETPLAAKAGEEDWQDYRNHCRKMVDAVIGGWPRGDADYQPIGAGFLEVSGETAAKVRQNLDLYDYLLTHQPDVPLLSQFARPSGTPHAADDRVESEFVRRLGHSNPQFPLADHQRQVLAWLDAAQDGEVIAVNGPPGTGKTTMLLSAVAGLWVQAAYRGGEPPVIVAASSNNQAVTNIIDAFGKDFASGEGPFAGRWLPDVKSFGMFLPSQTRKAEAMQRYQTEDFQAGLESEAGFLRAKDAYLSAARAAFPDMANPDVRSVVAALHGMIRLQVDAFSALDRSAAALDAALTERRLGLGEDPVAARLRFELDVRDRQRECETPRAAMKALEAHLGAESGLMALFSFLPPIARKRLLRARLAIGDFANDLGHCSGVSELETKLKDRLQGAENACREAQSRLDRADRLERQVSDARQRWDGAVSALDGGSYSLETRDELDRQTDINRRFRLFLLATHYWEGRWLMAMEADLASITASSSKQLLGLKSMVPRWHRRMMLTPCAVATFASLPGKMIYSRNTAGTFSKEYLLNFIDLLIVDEAGQVLPEVAGASFALAKKALVIGDTQQIAPISSLPLPIDAGNLNACKLLRDCRDEKAFEEIAARGLLSTSGSAMRLAQQACRISPWAELEKGLYLFEHRRCYDEIIRYCNALCYKGTLRPMRGVAPEAAPFPAMGYLHVDGRATSIGRSRANLLEAQTIASWLVEHRDRLEKIYGKRIEEVVGVITPFGRQAHEIREACAALNLSVTDRTGMTIGTVHSLQGAERPVILFSPVYSKHADGPFIDSSPSVLNVTVSRAKDSFLVFGDMDVFSAAASGTPRSLLSGFLHADRRNALDFTAKPRSDLLDEGQFITLRDASEHDAFLLSALSSEAKRFTIVSPWVIVSTMERAGILEGFAQAVKRGAEIDVYADPLLNAAPTKEGRSNMELAEQALSAIGVKLHGLPQLHSKIVAIDDGLLCIGSYNWLSADRQGQYARHETSFVYRGTHMAQEISTIVESLRRREK